MEIIVETLTHKELPFVVDASDRVEQLKVMIQDREGIPPDQQRLIFTGKQMEDERTLGDYNVSAGAKIILILRLRGC